MRPIRFMERTMSTAARVARAAEPGSAKNSSTASPPHLSRSAP